MRLGPFWRAAGAKPQPKRDATEWSYAWRELKELPAWSTSGVEPPAFAVVNNWRAGGKVGVALGPEVPVCAFTDDPRGFAFECDSGALLGQDALIAVSNENAGAALTAIAPYFERLGPAYEVGEGRAGQTERLVTLVRGHKLLRPYETPYGITPKPTAR